MLLQTVCCQLLACPREGLALLCIKVWMASVLGEAVSLSLDCMAVPSSVTSPPYHLIMSSSYNPRCKDEKLSF